MVAADTRPRAEDALELIEVDYEPLPAVVSTDDAAASAGAADLRRARQQRRVAGARRVRRRRCARSRAPIAIVRENLKIHRYSSTPLEPFACLAEHTPERLTIWCNAQSPEVIYEALTEALGIDHVRVDRARHRRRLRPEDSPDPQVRRAHRADGGQDRPAGEVDRGPQRAHDGRRPLLRAGVRRRGGGQGRRRSARPEDPRHRRRRRVGQHADDPLHQQAEQPVQHLQGPAPAARGALGAHQQVSRRAQPRHRQAGHVLHLGADDGPHRAGAGARSRSRCGAGT